MADRRMFSREIFQSSVMVKLGCGNPGFGLEAQRVWEALILTADDYGRGKLLPGSIRAVAFGTVPEVFATVTEQMITGWVEQIETEGAIQIYEVGRDKFYELTGWNKYQRGDWQRGESKLPAPPQSGNSGVTDAELLGTVGTKYKYKLKEKYKEKVHKNEPKNKNPDADASEIKANEAVAKWIDLMRELRDPEYQRTPIDVKQCEYAFKHLKGDLAEFENRARNYLSSDFVKKPTAAKFYGAIENYKDAEYPQGDIDF